LSETSPLKFYARASLVFAAVLALPALWSFFSAIVSAVSTGQVLVISVGRYETARQYVPWVQGWTRFVAPMTLFLSLAVWAGFSDRSRFTWWLSAALSAISAVMLLFSSWFISWRGVLWLSSLFLFIACSAYLGNRFGRFVAVAFIASVVGAIVWRISQNAV
jgi:hypothetical protein